MHITLTSMPLYESKSSTKFGFPLLTAIYKAVLFKRKFKIEYNNKH